MKPRLDCAREPGVATIVSGSRRVSAFYIHRPPSKPMASPATQSSEPFKTWKCNVCGLVYDEAEGWPEDGLAAGTRWEDVPAGWCCPECGARKEDFEMVDF